MNSPQTKHFTCMLCTGTLALWVLTGGIAFTQTQAGDTPNPPPAIQEESSSSNDQGEVVERGIIRRDHRGKPKVLAPPRTTTPSQPTAPPIVRDHRTQQAETSSNASTVSSRGPSPPLGPPSPTQPVKDIGINFLITSQIRNQVNDIVAKANASAAQQTNVRAKIKVEEFKEFGAGMSATKFTDRPNHRFVRIPYIITYRVHDVDKKTAVGWVSTGVTRKLSQSIGIHLFCDKWETGNGTIKLQTDIQPLYLENSQGTAEQIVDFFLNGHLTNFIDGLVRQQLKQIPITNGSTNLPFQCNSLAANKQQTTEPTDDTVDFNRPTTVRPITQNVLNSALNQVNVKFVSLKRLPARNRSGQPLYNAVETPSLEVYANFKHSFIPIQGIQEGQQISLNIPTLSISKPTGNEFLLVLANIIQNQAVGTQPTDSAYQVFPKEANYGNGTRTLVIKKSFWVPPNPPLQPKPLQILVDGYELTVQINAPGQLTADPGTGTAPTPGTVKPGIFNPVFQGTIMKRGVEPGEPAQEEPTESAPAQPEPFDQSSETKPE